MKFTKEKSVFDYNLFSNICPTHKNAPKEYSPILKFEKKEKQAGAKQGQSQRLQKLSLDLINDR